MGARKETKRDGILEAAARLIRTEGVHAASISRLIAESGASAGTIYHHFANKNEIVLAVADRMIGEPIGRLLTDYEGKGLKPSTLFRAVVDTVVRGEVESALIIQLWAGSSREPHLRAIIYGQFANIRAGVISRLEEWLRAQGVSDVETRAEAMTLLTMGQAMGLLAERTLAADLDLDSLVSHACAMLDTYAMSWVEDPSEG